MDNFINIISNSHFMAVLSLDAINVWSW